MATTSTSPIANLFSFFNPFKPPPSAVAPPVKVSLSDATSSSRDHRSSKPLIAAYEPPPQPSISSSDVMSVVCPSLTYANTLFFRSAYNVQVIVDDNEPEEKLLGRFRREVMRAGVIQECKRRRFFENKQDKDKRKTREAAKRNRRRRTPFRSGPPDRQEASKDKKSADADDNWDLPEGVLP